MKTKTNAAIAYRQNADQLRNLLEQVTSKLKAHEAAFAASGQKDWGYVGDLEYYTEHLEIILGLRG